MPGIQDLPLIARLPLAVATRTTGLAWSVARGVGVRLIPGSSRERPRGDGDTAARPTPTPEPARRSRGAQQAPAAPPAAPRTRPAPEPPAPAHVDREAVLVAESADQDAAEGVGANVHVTEPWENYAVLTADEVIDRLAAADAESIAAVRLYEGTHRRRSTVIAEADRRLATAGSGHQTHE